MNTIRVGDWSPSENIAGQVDQTEFKAYVTTILHRVKEKHKAVDLKVKQQEADALLECSRIVKNKEEYDETLHKHYEIQRLRPNRRVTTEYNEWIRRENKRKYSLWRSILAFFFPDPKPEQYEPEDEAWKRTVDENFDAAVAAVKEVQEDPDYVSRLWYNPVLHEIWHHHTDSKDRTYQTELKNWTEQLESIVNDVSHIEMPTVLVQRSVFNLLSKIETAMNGDDND